MRKSIGTLFAALLGVSALAVLNKDILTILTSSKLAAIIGLSCLVLAVVLCWVAFFTNRKLCVFLSGLLFGAAGVMPYSTDTNFLIVSLICYVAGVCALLGCIFMLERELQAVEGSSSIADAQRKAEEIIRAAEARAAEIAGGAAAKPGVPYAAAHYSPEKKKSAGKKVLKVVGIVLLIVVVLFAFILKWMYSSVDEAVERMNEKTEETSSPTKVREPKKVEAKRSGSTGQQNALQSALSYLKHSSFSKQELYKQLEYEGYTENECAYAVENCGADWMNEAKESAVSYIKNSSFSESGLLGQLKYEGFTDQEAEYGVAACGANWQTEAIESAQSYLSHSSFSRVELIEQLEYEGFSHAQAENAVNQVYK